jgi:predicted aspartyl protease
MNKLFSIVIILLILVSSCTRKKEQPAFYDTENIESATNFSADSIIDSGQEIGNADIADIISVPFREDVGIKYVNVSVNGFGFEMIFDTGCSGTLISVAEANYLYEKGYLKADDYLGKSHSQIADGSIVENMVFNLKEVIIDGKIRCTDVTATVSSNSKAPLLLGNEVLNRVASYTIDNESKTINFKLK